MTIGSLTSPENRKFEGSSSKLLSNGDSRNVASHDNFASVSSKEFLVRPLFLLTYHPCLAFFGISTHSCFVLSSIIVMPLF